MEQRIEIERLEEAANLFGSFDENIRLIESEFHVVVTNREGELRIAGDLFRQRQGLLLAPLALHQLEEAQRLRHPRHRQGHAPGQLPLVPRCYFITSIP